MAKEEASLPKVLIFTAPILCFECEEKAPNLTRKGEFLIGTGKNSVLVKMASYRWHHRPLVVGGRTFLWSELSRAIYRKDKRITIATNLEWGLRTFQLNHANLECLKQMSPKPGDLKREDFQNICQIKPKKQIIFVMIFFTSIGQWVAKLRCHKAFPQTLANLWFMEIRIELDSVIFSDSLWNFEAT